MKLTYAQAKDMLRRSIEDKRDVVFAGKIYAIIGFIEKLEKLENLVENIKRNFRDWRVTPLEARYSRQFGVKMSIKQLFDRQEELFGLKESEKERKITIVIKSRDDLKLKDWVGWFHDANLLKCDEQNIDFKIEVE